MMMHARTLHCSTGYACLAALAMLSCAAGSAGAQVEVYFNRSVDTMFAYPPGNVAHGDRDFASLVETELSLARFSVDMTMYSLNSARVVEALIAARNRGVKVRVIGHVGNLADPGARFAQLATAGIPVAANPTAPDGDTQPLMHDKFIVIDARTGAPADAARVTITGSWNATQAQTYLDANNLVVVRDRDVAAAYLREFEQMWGSADDIPDTSTARFGSRKTSIGPHEFTLQDGTRLECRFSPRDSTSARVRAHLAGAETSVLTAHLTFTYASLADALRQRRDAGADVRCLVDNVDDTGSQFGFLASFADALDWRRDELLHHKYAVVDALPFGAGGAPFVITGSHNWTFSAESRNDENTLMLWNALIANQFLQEFVARYKDAGGTRPFVTTSDVREDGSSHRTATGGAGLELRAYPNPFTGSITLALGATAGTITISDAVGRILAHLEPAPGQSVVTWQAGGLANGVYCATLRYNGAQTRCRLILLR